MTAAAYADAMTRVRSANARQRHRGKWEATKRDEAHDIEGEGGGMNSREKLANGAWQEAAMEFR